MTTPSTGNNVFVPASTESFTYDEDGNLKVDGRWTYTWDSENRLKEVVANSNVPDAAKRKVQFTYDHLGRRASKTVWSYSGGSYVNPVTTRFVYDGWRVVAELDATSNVLRSYGWGLDLSGSMDGAGGIGGLWAVKTHGTGATDNFVAYDGNGNVTALVDASTQTASARYEYGPFGELVRSSGMLAKVNPFRFSTRWQDEETELVYYGYRYYSTSLGRWLSRDVAEEQGGNNLFAFVLNRPLTVIDTLGDAPFHSGRDHAAWHVHDGDLTYGVQINDDGTFETWARKGHEKQYDSKAAEQSFKDALTDPSKRAKLIEGNLTEHREGASRQGYWDNFPNARGLMSQQGRNLWKAAKGATRGVLGIMAIVTAVQTGTSAAQAAENYGRFRARGDTAMADLEAIDIAIAIQDGTGNYYMGYMALDILLD